MRTVSGSHRCQGARLHQVVPERAHRTTRLSKSGVRCAPWKGVNMAMVQYHVMLARKSGNGEWETMAVAEVPLDVMPQLLESLGENLSNMERRYTRIRNACGDVVAEVEE